MWQDPAAIVEKWNQYSLIVELADGSRNEGRQNKIREVIARSIVVNIVFDTNEEFREIGKTPLLESEQEVGRDIERFDIKELSNNQVRDINTFWDKIKVYGSCTTSGIGWTPFRFETGCNQIKAKILYCSYCL